MNIEYHYSHLLFNIKLNQLINAHPYSNNDY